MSIMSVQLQSMSRDLMIATMGVIKVRALNQERFKQVTQAVVKQKEEYEQIQDLSFDLTSSLIDKRYRESKQFLQTGQTSIKRYKTTTTSQQKALDDFTSKQVLQARTRLSSNVSRYNKMILDRKVSTSYKLIDERMIL